MIKLVTFFKRKAELSPEAFQVEWRGAHVEKALAIPGLRGYVQSHVLLSGYRKGEPFCDGLAEMWFDDRAALDQARESAAFARARADADRFRESSTAGAMLTVEYLIKDGPKPKAGVKDVEFVVRKRDLAPEAFHRYWREHHGPLAARIAPIRRYVQSHAIDDPGTRGYDGIASTWFDDTAAMRASATTEEYRLTREDEANFVTGPLSGIIAREHVAMEPPAPSPTPASA
ncbi:MAG: EthD family reductase [Candidatus Binatia bacterium]